jgi:dTDP-4-dehydrorhamnose 3,5-epimerase
MTPEVTEIPGLFLMHSRVIGDARGSFLKLFHAPSFAEAGLRADWRESYHSSSAGGVIRGMHFQVPPADHAKLVFCLEGEVLDVVLDLRRGSPSEGRAACFTLSGDGGTGVYIPSGCAHGFLGVSERSTMLYMVTSAHSPEHDAGVAWNSFGFDWPVSEPILSDRDSRHPLLSDFVSPFTFAR